MKPFKVGLFILILSLLLAGCATGEQATPVASSAETIELVLAEGHIVPARDVKLSFATRGSVEEILVKEGQTVKQGDILIKLADQEQAQAALAAANLELTAAQQAYDVFQRSLGLNNAQAWQAYLDAQVARAAAERAWEALDLDRIDDEIDDAQADVEDRIELLDDAQTEFNKYKDLNKDNATRKSAEDDLIKAQDDYNEALRVLQAKQREKDSLRAQLDAALGVEAEAKRKFDQTSAGADADALAVLEARLNNATAQLAAAQNALDNYTLVAAFNGVVTDVNVKIGQFVGPELWAVQMADFSNWYVETNDLTELEVVNVSEGQKVEISPDALEGVVLMGTVESIGQSFKSQGGDVIYTVKIKLDEKDSALRWGMTVEVAFLPE